MDPIATELPSSLQPPSLAGLDRARLRQSVYRRVFGDADPVKIGRYTVLERIGAGGMGVVFKAYDTQLDRKVAVKVIQFEGGSEAGRRALVKEARALARLSHPNVVHVYEVAESRDGELFLAMEFVEGVTLRAWLGRQNRRWPDVLDVCLQAGEGLAAAHAASLVHRDFKPENVMVGDDGRVRVLDFGLARRGAIAVAAADPTIDASATTTTTVGRSVAGTPAYMAPEQMAGGSLGPAVDQFALCATLFEALYGVRPFEGATLSALHESVRDARLTVPDARCGVPKAVHRLIVQGLAADPERRHASVQVLVGELRRARRAKSLRRAIPMAAMSALITSGILVASGRGEESSHVAAPATDTAAQDELVLLRAESQIDDDPTASIATLAELPENSPAWNARAHVIAEQADLWGVADRELVLPESLDLQDIAGDGLVSHRAVDDTIVLTALDTGATRTILTDVARPPVPEMFTATEETRPRMHVSPGGRFVVLAHAGRTTIADLETDTSLPLPDLDARELSFMPDGSFAAVSESNGVGIYRLATGERIRGVSLPAGTHRAVVTALDRAAHWVAVGRADGPTVVHRLADGSSLALDDNGAQDLAFASYDVLVTAARAGGMRIWNLEDGTSTILGARESRYFGLSAAGGGRYIVSRTDSNELWLHELATGKGTLMGEGYAPAVSPDERWVMWIDEAGRVQVRDLTSRTARALASSAPISACAFAADSASITTFGADRVARHWPLHTDAPALEGHIHSVDAIAFSLDGLHLFSASRDHTLRRWDVQSGHATLVVPVEGEIIELDLSSNGEILASRTAGGTIEARTADGLTLLGRTAPDHTGMAFGGDVLIVTDDSAAWRWDLATDERTKLLPEVGACHGIAVSPDASRLAGACGDHIFEAGLRVWDLERAALIHEDRSIWFSMAFVGPRELVGGPLDEAMRLLDVDTGLSTPFASSRAGWRRFSATPDGHSFALASAPDGVQLWTREAATKATVPGTRNDADTLVALSPDGRRLAYSIDRRVISIRDRTVPRDPEALRAWVLEHRVQHVEAQ